MNQNNRFCSQQGHQQVEVNHICTYRLCSKSRWCCSLCRSEKTHYHQISKTHIMNSAELSDKVKYDVENLKKSYLNSEYVSQIKNLLLQMVKETQVLEQNLFQLRQNLERQLNNLISEDDNFNHYQFQQKVNIFQNQMMTIQINCLISNNINFKILVYPNYKTRQTKFNSNLKCYYKIQKIQNKIQLMNYEIQEIQGKRDKKFYINSSNINKKEEYLVYNVNNIINIQDIKLKRIHQRIKQKNKTTQFQFSLDSKYLFAVDENGFVYGYIVLNGLKIFYKQQIHMRSIRQIIILKQYLITAAYDKTIIKTDFIKKTQIFKLIGHTSYIFSIDYDIQNDIILSTSSDNSIKIWDCANQSILIDYLDNVYYDGIQLMNNKQDIICNSYKKLLKFTIDYQNKKLVKNDFQKEEIPIIGFYSVNNDQILVIFQQHCKILDKQGLLISLIKHNLGLEYEPYGIQHNRKQLDNLNYIILQDQYTICLLRVKNWN